jgi:glucose-1-phosphate cytidylyltransferase
MTKERVVMKTVILAGGLGTRLAEETGLRPKPMVEIGGKPILWHIMKHYGAHDVQEFVIALGYKSEVVKDYFMNYHALSSDITVNLRTGDVTAHAAQREDWRVHLVETGLHTQTGGRIRRLKAWIGGETFMMTYGDGVSDVDVRALMAFHKQHGKLATITAVRPPARFGDLVLEGDHIRQFAEKPQSGEGWINGGFMVLEPQVCDLIEGDASSFEREVLEPLSAQGELMAYRHTGFWQSMDTLRDKTYLEQLWQSGQPQWKTWHD